MHAALYSFSLTVRLLSDGLKRAISTYNVRNMPRKLPVAYQLGQQEIRGEVRYITKDKY